MKIPKTVTRGFTMAALLAVLASGLTQAALADTSTAPGQANQTDQPGAGSNQNNTPPGQAKQDNPGNPGSSNGSANSSNANNASNGNSSGNGNSSQTGGNSTAPGQNPVNAGPGPRTAPGCAFGPGGRKPTAPPNGGVNGQTQTALGCNKPPRPNTPPKTPPSVRSAPRTVTPASPQGVVVAVSFTLPNGTVVTAGTNVVVNSGTISPSGTVLGANITVPGVGTFNVPQFESQVAGVTVSAPVQAPAQAPAGVAARVVPASMPGTGGGGGR